MEKFTSDFPNYNKDFRRYSELTEDPSDVLKAALKLRNTIIHSNSSSLNAADVSKMISSGLLPLLQTIYFNKFNVELLDKLDSGLSKMFTTAFFLRKNFNLTGDDWSRILNPLIWYLQHTLSPIFIPGTLYDEFGIEIDRSKFEWNALENLQSKNWELYTDDEIPCPCCNGFTIAVKYGFPEVNGKERISIEEMYSVNCNLELLSSELDQLISETLLDTFLTENEPRLRASFA